ncbi:hypothetical protein EJ03DRAFT_91017 [Teratosphaeria nubilosa]|uniref:Uncharacterized protein n=1 Tax=Teratosphaeria nubilosa TaxID=161662 RepID=A0A6G1LB62_9PEZI|nr:hypothetical protein EJ03DRAFT_91017 [Teratosphaeria nubilosa]
METPEWPTQPLPQTIKDLINHFYELAELCDQSSGQRLADTVFAKEGKLIINKRILAGPKGASIPQPHNHRLNRPRARPNGIRQKSPTTASSAATTTQPCCASTHSIESSPATVKAAISCSQEPYDYVPI